jgi:hypothetical protein
LTTRAWTGSCCRQQLGRIDTCCNRGLDRLNRQRTFVSGRRTLFRLDTYHVAVERRLAAAAEVKTPAINEADRDIAVVTSADGLTSEYLVASLERPFITCGIDRDNGTDNLSYFTC